MLSVSVNRSRKKKTSYTLKHNYVLYLNSIISFNYCNDLAGFE